MKLGVAAGALLAFALAARLAMLLTLEGKPLFAEPILDSAAYDRWAQQIAGGNFWGDRAFYQDPLYPYGLGIFYKIFGRHLLAVKILQVLLGVAGLWCLFEGTRRLAGPAVALATLALAAVYRTTAFYDVVLLKEFLGPLAIEVAFLLIALGLTTKRWWWWALAGAALGLGALVRGNMLVLAPAVAAALFLLRERRAAGYLLAGAALAVLPCTLRNALVAHEFVVTTAQAGPNLYIGNNAENWTGRYRPPDFLEAASPDFEERDFRREAQRRLNKPEVSATEVSSYWRGEALAAMRAEPWSFVAATFRRAMLLLNDWEVPDNYSISFARRWSWALALPWMTFGLVLWPLAAAGLYLSWIERRKHALAYVLLAGAVVPVVFFFVFDRYRLPAVPMLFFFAGYGVVKAYETWRWRMRRLPAIAAGVAAVALLHANLPPSIYGVGDTGPFAQYYNLAGWHRGRHEPVSAAAAMDQAFALRPEMRKHPRLGPFAADCYMDAGRESDALPLYVDAGDHGGAARAYLKLRNPERAAEHFETAVLRSPSSLELRLELADAQARAGRSEEALRTLARAATAWPSEPGPQLGRARLFRALGMWPEALEAATAAIERSPLKRQTEAEEIRREAAQRMGRRSP